MCVLYEGEAHGCEERARNAMIDAARLAEELRAEQEQTAFAENARKMADALIKDLQLKVSFQLVKEGGVRGAHFVGRIEASN